MLDPHQPLSRRSKIVRWVGILLLMKRAFIALKTEKERLNPLYHEQSELCVFFVRHVRHIGQMRVEYQVLPRRFGLKLFSDQLGS